MVNVIERTEVVKHFGSVTALDGLDLVLERGKVHAFLGPNGAGKTTTLRPLLGNLRADDGQLHVLGMDPGRDVRALHAELAYVPGDANRWPNLTGSEVIDLPGRLQGGHDPGGHDPGRRDEMIELLDLTPTKKARSYWKGDRQKIALSHFQHTPHVPAGSSWSLPLLSLVAVAAPVSAAGFSGWRNRDVPA